MVNGMFRRLGLAVLLVITGAIAIQLIPADCPTAPTIRVAVADQVFAIPREINPSVWAPDVSKHPETHEICQGPEVPPIQALDFVIVPSHYRTKDTWIGRQLGGAQLGVIHQRDDMGSIMETREIVADQLRERGRSVEKLPRDGNFRVLANPEKKTWYFIEFSSQNQDIDNIKLYLECRGKPDHGLGRNCQSISKWSDGVKLEIRFWENGMTPRDRWSELDDIAWNALREWHTR